MNLEKLFEAQRVLDERIEQEHPRVDGENRLMDKCLALLVELGECANEQRTWKFWSKNKNPVTKSIRPIFGTNVDGTQFQDLKECNPLLEEYVDVLHFTLSIGNRIGFREDVTLPEDIAHYVQPFPTNWSASSAFGYVYRATCSFMEKAMYRESKLNLYYLDLILSVLGLAPFLGFSWEDIETAYYEKNKINHERQDSNY